MVQDLICVILFLAVFSVTRVCYVLIEIRRSRRVSCGQWTGSTLRNTNEGRSTKNIKTMIVAGSGGHTAEMLKLVDALSSAYNPRHYVVAVTDKMSNDKINSLEKSKQYPSSEYVISHIPRSREVGQSWFTTVASTLNACLYSTILVFKSRPNLLLCNGPGTCLPLCLAAFARRVFGIERIKIVFIESLCRVNTLSLTGRILYYISDQFVVQWPDLQKKYPLSTYMGRIV